MKTIRCNWCGKEHFQPAQSALEALATCCRVPQEAEAARENLYAATLARTNWKMLARQKQCLARLLTEMHRVSHCERAELIGVLHWLDAIQEAAEAEGYPVEFLAE